MTEFLDHHPYIQAVVAGDVVALDDLHTTVQGVKIIAYAVETAIAYDEVACLDFLLARLPSVLSLSCKMYLDNAVVSGREQCVERILSYVNEDVVYLQLLQSARWGYTCGFAVMFARLSDNPYQRNSVFAEAIKSHNLNAVRLILPHVDPKAYNSLALQVACLAGNFQVFDLLFPLSDPKAAVSEMRAHRQDPLLIEQRITQTNLWSALDDTGADKNTVLKRKM